MDQEKLRKAQQLRDKAEDLEREAFNERPLPDFWRVGQKVRMLNDEEWAWGKGNIMVISKVSSPHLPASHNQVIYLSTLEDGWGSFYATPKDVELVEDVEK